MLRINDDSFSDKLFKKVPHPAQTIMRFLEEVEAGPRGLCNWKPVFKKRRVFKRGEIPGAWEYIVDYLDRCYGADAYEHL